LHVCCSPVRRERRWRYAIEGFCVCAKRTRRTLHWSWRDSRQNVNSAPAGHIVWWTGRPARLVGDKMSRVIQRCPTSGNVVTELRSRAPKQRHGASDMRRRHGRPTKSRISIIRCVIAGTSTCAGRGDIRFDSVTPIHRHGAAAAKVCHDILAGIQSPDRVRCRIDRRRIHHGGTSCSVIACSRYHHNSGGGLSFDRSLQRVSRTTFRRRTDPGVTRNIGSSKWIALATA
jgi:hypothetical protein